MELKQHRKAAGLSQLDLARALGYRRRDTIGRWENNPDSISLGNLKAYARACGVTLADLLGYDGEAQTKLDAIWAAFLDISGKYDKLTQEKTNKYRDDML